MHPILLALSSSQSKEWNLFESSALNTSPAYFWMKTTKQMISQNAVFTVWCCKFAKRTALKIIPQSLAEKTLNYAIAINSMHTLQLNHI